MKGSKYSKLVKPGSWKGFMRSRRTLLGGLIKLDYNLSTFMMLVAISGLIVMLCCVACHGSSGLSSQIPEWDRQRRIWMDQHPTMRQLAEERPRIMMVTGSSPQLCDSAVESHVILQSAKNKLDYCRLHNIPLYYSLGNPNPHPRYSVDWWVTLPIVRMLMLQHPEVEWFWWVDADAVFTDMSLEPRFADLKDHNLVLFREDRGVKTGLHTGNYLIRNCQWSLDLIQAWATVSTKTPDYNISTTSISDSAPEGTSETTFDARKWAVVTSLLVPTQTVGDKVKETENWEVIAPNLEDLQVKHQQQQDNVGGLPLVTHFPGCMPCSTAPSDDAQLSAAIQQQQEQEQEEEEEEEEEREDVCLTQLDRTFDFADNQVYDQFGFQWRALGSSKTYALTKLATKDGDAARETNDAKDFSMLPGITDWDEQRRARMEESSRYGKNDNNNRVMLVSGSSPVPCDGASGGSMLLRGLKNKIDYCRLHGIEFFYNMAGVDKDFMGWWSKLPLLRMLMLKNPEVEWFWWSDSDAVVTDMDFEIPFERYNVNGGYNLVMYGKDSMVYDERDFRAINTGNFFLRNSQWSIDLLDRWASFATSVEVRKKNGEVLTAFLKERPTNWEADDQGVLVYMLITERERWSSKVLLENPDENPEVDMSATWSFWTPRFLDNVHLSYKPFVTHFAGCTPCGNKVTEECLAGMDRVFHFADNQVLESSELCHEHLRSQKIVSSCNIESIVI